jgi:hypothetical protein
MQGQALAYSNIGVAHHLPTDAEGSQRITWLP